MKILRKSWGTNRSGCPSVPVRPVAVSAASSSLRMAGAATGRFSVPTCRRVAGTGSTWWVEDPLVIVVGGHERDRGGVVAGPGDDGAEHVGQFGVDDQQPFSVGLGRDDVQ